MENKPDQEQEALQKVSDHGFLMGWGLMLAIAGVLMILQKMELIDVNGFFDGMQKSGWDRGYFGD